MSDITYTAIHTITCKQLPLCLLEPENFTSPNFHMNLITMDRQCYEDIKDNSFSAQSEE